MRSPSLPGSPSTAWASRSPGLIVTVRAATRRPSLEPRKRRTSAGSTPASAARISSRVVDGPGRRPVRRASCPARLATLVHLHRLTWSHSLWLSSVQLTLVVIDLLLAAVLGVLLERSRRQDLRDAQVPRLCTGAGTTTPVAHRSRQPESHRDEPLEDPA